MRTYALILLVAVTVSTAVAAEEKKPEKKDGEGTSDPLSLDFDLESPVPPAAPPDLGGLLDLDLEELSRPPVPPKPLPVVAEEPLPPPPVPEPAPLPTVTVKRVSLPPADPMPAPSPPPKEEREARLWRFSLGVTTSIGGMSAATTRGLSVPDGGSFLVGGLFAAEFSSWEGRLSVRRFYQDRWLAANIRSDGGVEGSIHVGRWLGSPVQNLSFGILGGGSYRSHGAPVGAWWKDRGPAPAEWRAEAVPSLLWHFPGLLDLAVSVPCGYGFGSVDQREWRNFTGPFATLEIGFRMVLG